MSTLFATHDTVPANTVNSHRPRILAFSASNRTGSYNRLLAIAATDALKARIAKLEARCLQQAARDRGD